MTVKSRAEYDLSAAIVEALASTRDLALQHEAIMALVDDFVAAPRCIANEVGRDHCDHSNDGDQPGETVNICCWCGRRAVHPAPHGIHETDVPM